MHIDLLTLCLSHILAVVIGYLLGTIDSGGSD